jgi:ketosteroid isomerase-like protein
MTAELPRIIQSYFDSSNRHAVQSILSSFSDDAVVRDEGKTLHGQSAIEGWIRTTIEKYKFYFNPLGIKHEPHEIVVAVEVSGAFDGSPITLDYHFRIAAEKIVSLAID